MPFISLSVCALLQVPTRFRCLLGMRRVFKTTSLQDIRKILLTHVAGTWSRTGLLESVKITIAGRPEVDGVQLPSVLRLLDLPGLAANNRDMMHLSISALKRSFPGMLQMFSSRTPTTDIEEGMRESGILTRVVDDLPNFFVVSAKALDKALNGVS